MVTLFLFIFGLCVGSFLSCWVYRINNEMPLANSPTVRGVPSGHLGGVSLARSACDHCGKQLAWHDNLPLLSFLFLRGKSRCCRSPIPFQYFLVELSTAFLTVIVYHISIYDISIYHIWSFGLSLLIVYFLIAIFISDLNYQTVPDVIIFPAILVALIYAVTMGQFSNLTIGALTVFLPTALFFLLSRLKIRGQQTMGFGDVEIAFLMSLFLGFPKIIVALYLAFLTGAVFGVILIMLSKKKFASQIAFGPFLVAGTMISFFYGGFIWQKIISGLP